MKISLVIAFYKNIPALELILIALEQQTYKNFEAIIAEDNNSKSAAEIIEKFKTDFHYKIKHVFHEDSGFRKNKIMNAAIKISEGDYIVFIDGDCIPHRKFLQAYANSAEENAILFARRVMLSKKITERLYSEKKLDLLSFFSLIFFGSKSLKYSFYLPFIKQKRKLGIYGCNWGVYKKHLIAVNGFDEDYTTSGVGEDNDIEWRLLGFGLQLISIRFSAIQYHLNHAENYSDDDVKIGLEMMKIKKQQNFIACKNGIEKI